MKVLVGVTGGIASGKSAFSAFLSDLGAALVDADQVAREVVEPQSPGLEKIREVFGDDVVDEQGALRRQVLGDKVFGDVALRTKLNSILHPLIALRSRERIRAFMSSAHPYIVYDAALLIETGAYKGMTHVVVVDSADDKRIERLLERDELTLKQAEERIAAQMTSKERNQFADTLIDNSGSLEELKKAAESFHFETLKKIDVPT